MSSERPLLGQLLVDARLVSEKALGEILQTQAQDVDGRRLGAILVEKGIVSETQLTQILSHQLSVPWVSLLHIEFSRKLLNLVPHDVAEKYCVVPIYVRQVKGQGETLYIAMDDPTDEEGVQACAKFSGLPVKVMIAQPSDIRNAIRVYYGGIAGGQPSASAKPPEARAAMPTLRPESASEQAVPLEPEPVPSEPEPEPEPEEAVATPKPRAARVKSKTAEPSNRRTVSLTLLDGTTVKLPSPKNQRRGVSSIPPAEHGLTARDLVTALRATANGADASEALGSDVKWEGMFAALLSLLMRKHLIADWEFVEELYKTHE